MPGKYRKTTQGNEERKKITVYLSKEMHEKIREIAYQNKHSVSAECENIIEKEFQEASPR